MRLAEWDSDICSSEYDETRAFKFQNVDILDRMRGNWPGPQKNVQYWVTLANGYAVGRNENPSRGLSFPVIKLHL